MPESYGLVDTHAHITFPEYDNDREDVINRAFGAGFEAIIAIGSGAGIEGNRRAVKAALEHENIFATAGLHPHEAESVSLEEAVEELKELSGSPKVVAIGEIGLDYFHKHSSETAQKKVFKRLIELADELRLPVIIHDREAHTDTIKILDEMKERLHGGIFHCFSGDVNLAKNAIRLGFYIAVPGVITFKKADVLKKVVKEINIERLVLETDCPYLAPVPFRGKRNEPLYVKYIAEEVANIKSLSADDVARITTINARRALSLPGNVTESEIAYPIRRSLYINLTNKCTLACTFCPKRSGNFEVKGHNLKLIKEPDAEEVIRAIKSCHGYDEVVFCGFGEPTQKLDTLKEVAKYVKNSGTRVRIDTDGLANLIYDRDILPELNGLVDAVSVSMNAPTPQKYEEICPSKFGREAFYAMLSFLESAKNYFPDVTATVVALPGLDVAACERLALEMGVKFRVREYQNLG